MATDDLKRAVYEQDCQSWRHQDNLQWSRFQTAATIEAGTLYVLYQTKISHGEKLIFAFFGFWLVLIVCLLAWKDNRDAHAHLSRTVAIQNSVQSWTPAPYSLPEGWGTHLLIAAIATITLLNLVVFFSGWLLGFSVPG
jgi:hypothetical protein